ncbi:hypothetical protein C8Q75DRAFT_703460, partial [Abortiporus biennis]
MLSVLKRTAARALEGTSDLGESCFGLEEEAILYLNVDELRDLIPQLPGISWHRVAELCSKTVTPICSAVKKSIDTDVEHLANVFAELEANSKVIKQIEYQPTELFIPVERTRKRRRSSVSDLGEPLIIKPSDPSLPTIVITPCDPEPQDCSYWIPYQDAEFGNKLTLPSHPTLNAVHPPMLPKASPLVENWRYHDGHWWAELPCLEEQIEKGMFSRPTITRRRRNPS